jgi:hypothetical protein
LADESGPLTRFPKLAKFLRLPTAVGFLSNEIHLQHRGRVNVRYWHKADMLNALTNVRYRHKADMLNALTNVRYRG